MPKTRSRHYQTEKRQTQTSNDFEQPCSVAVADVKPAGYKFISKPVPRQCSAGVTLGTTVQKEVGLSYALFQLPSYPIGDWITWSMTPHSTNEIRRRLTEKSIDKTCMSYLCRFSKIDPDFLDELVVLSSGMFHAEGTKDLDLRRQQPFEYNKENIDYFISKFHHSLDESVEILPMPKEIAIYKETHEFSETKPLIDRMDWLYIARFQKYGPDVWAKYKKPISSCLRNVVKYAPEVAET